MRTCAGIPFTSSYYVSTPIVAWFELIWDPCGPRLLPQNSSYGGLIRHETTASDAVLSWLLSKRSSAWITFPCGPYDRSVDLRVTRDLSFGRATQLRPQRSVICMDGFLADHPIKAAHISAQTTNEYTDTHTHTHTHTPPFRQLRTDPPHSSATTRVK